MRIEVCKHEEMPVKEVCLVKGADTVGSSSSELTVSVSNTLRIVMERAWRNGRLCGLFSKGGRYGRLIIM